MLVRGAWDVDSVSLHLQSVDTTEFIVVVVRREEVAPSQVYTVVGSGDSMGAVGVDMQRGVIAMHVEANRDSFEQGDVGLNKACSEQSVD